MLLTSLLLIPLVGIFAILTTHIYSSTAKKQGSTYLYNLSSSTTSIKTIALFTSIINLIISLIIYLLFDFSSNQFQFVQEYHEISSFDFYLGLDGLSIYFVLLTTIITPIALLSN
jgi:NADH:ubiquinone oxidoreductase subunit 4 (subunit M)